MARRARKTPTPAAPATPKKTKKSHPGPRPERFQGRLSAQEDCDGLPGVEKFFTEHAAAYRPLGFGKAKIDAAHRISLDLCARLEAFGPDPRRAALVPPEATAALAAAHGLLHAARDAVYRRSRGKAGAAARRRYRLDVSVNARSLESVRDAIAGFLRGVAQDPATAALAYVQESFLAGLRAAQAALQSFIAQKAPNRLGKKTAQAEVARLHRALEEFYDDFGAATSMAFAKDPKTRALGLAAIPRPPREAAPRPAPAPGTPAAGGPHG
jgi:hypothetical protein